MKIAKVIIEHPVSSLDIPFDYYIPNDLNVIKGIRVIVEFKFQIITGYVEDIIEVDCDLSTYEENVGYEVNTILNCLDYEPLLTNELQQLAHHLAHVTAAPLISCYQAMLPPSLKPSSGNKVGIKTEKIIVVIDEDDTYLTLKQKEALKYFIDNPRIKRKDAKYSQSIIKTLIEKKKIEYELVEVYRNPLDKNYPLIEGPKITDDQAKVIFEFENTNDTTYLLEGVTGSGKTEVYINLAKSSIKKGKDVIILVPEISLTPQMVKRFKERLDVGVAVFHSGLTPAEKYDEYRRVARGEARVIIGARSAIFVPCKKLGLIIIDEEHSESYKQDSTPGYHVLDAALFRAKYNNAKLLLGSATPSLESKTRALKNIYHPLYLLNRINKMPLPKVEIVNMLNEIRHRNYIFSGRLITEINKCLENKKQIILLLNRRGYSSSLTCQSCGHTFSCPNCEIPLHYHEDDNKLKCHYCGYEVETPQICPDCGSKYLRKNGVGTQRVEAEIARLFPNAKTIRMDFDSVKKAKSYEKILDAFANHDYDILLGTQMIAKGLDFKNVTLVGVLNADVGLYQMDFRSGERTFQLLTQVVGRSGRGDDEGIAIIQTMNPSNYAIRYAAKHDFKNFYIEEMNYRKIRKYPPYRYLLSLTFLGRNIDEVEICAEYIKSIIKSHNLEDLIILGPAQPYIAKINNKYRLRMMVKYKDKEKMLEILHELKDIMLDYKKVEMQADTSPYSEF